MKANPSTKPGAITSLGNTFSNDFINTLPLGYFNWLPLMERLRYFRTRRAGHFATFVSPARKLAAFGLLLDLTSRNTQPIWSRQVFGLPACKPTPQAEGLGCVPKRSQGGARRAGDMSGGTYP